MGAAVSVIAVPAVMGLISGIEAFIHNMIQPSGQNSTMHDIEERNRREEEHRKAEQEHHRRQEEARQAEEQRRINEEQRRMNEEEQRRQEAERRRQEEEWRRMEAEKAEIERKMQEAARQAEEDRQKNEEERKRMELERAEKDRQLMEERQRAAEERRKAGIEKARLTREHELAVQVAKQLVEEERRLKEAECLAKEEEGRARKIAEAMQKEAEDNLRRGIRPVECPTTEQVKETKIRLQIMPDRFHFAVAGISGSGKSSLINAMRGLKNNQSGAAKAGVTETTSVVTRYPDNSLEKPYCWMVWYDVPGAGTLNVKDWQYFNDQGLYVFDFIIAVIDNRFTETDVAVLKNCSRFEIPSFIVRSKANQHIRNMMEDDEDLSEAEAVQALVLQTRANIRQNLQQVELDPDQYVYIVSKDTLCTLVKSRFDPSLVPKGPIIDEPKLIHDLLKAAHDRRSLTGGRLKISLGGLNLDSLSLGRKGKEIGDAGPPRN